MSEERANGDNLHRLVRPSVAEHRAFMRGYRMGFRRARLDGVEDSKRAWSAWIDQRNHRKRDDWHDDLCPMCVREMEGPNTSPHERATARTVQGDVGVLP